jgi:hypothetical protein
MTSLEAALQEEVDMAVRRRRDAIQAQGEHDDEHRHAERMRQETLHYSKRHTSPPISISSSGSASLPPSFQPPNSMPSSHCPSSSSSSDDDDGGDGEVEDQRPRRSKPRKSLKAIENSQQRRDGLLGGGPKAKELAKRRKPGKKALAAAAEMSQLLDAYVPPPSDTVILDS